MIHSSVPSRQPKRDAWTMERLVHERSIALGMALSRSTQRAYGSHLNSYLDFCSLHHFDIDPTPDTLSFYLTYASHHIEPHSVLSYLTGIVRNLEPHYPHARTARSSRLVTRAMQGCLRRHLNPTRRKQPLTRDHLTLLSLSFPPPHSHDDLLFLAQAFTGFFALLRLSELVVPDTVALRNSLQLPRRSSVSISPSDYRFDLRCDKSDHLFEGNTIVVQKSTSLPDPYLTFTTYLSSRDHRFPFHPHLWLRADGSPPTRSWFLSRLHRVLPSSIAGHSLRAGGATSLAAAGVPPSQIQAIGPMGGLYTTRPLLPSDVRHASSL